MWYLRLKSFIMFHIASSVPLFQTKLLRFSVPPPRPLCSYWEKEAVGDRLCHSLPGLFVTIPPLSKAPQQKGWWGIVWDVSGSLEGACREALDMGEGMTPGSCGATVSLSHAPGTGPCHLKRLNMSGGVMSATAERHPPLLKHQWLFIQKV